MNDKINEMISYGGSERAILTIIIRNPDYILKCEELGLKKEHFSVKANRYIYSAIAYLLTQGYDKIDSIAIINTLDKKSAETAKQKLAMLLMLGRSFNIHVIISQQRLDASYFSSARDNFSVVIGMGHLSKESVEMMFSDYKDIIVRSKSQGHGSMLLGNQFLEIAVPRVRDVKHLHSTIISAVKRPEDKNR